MASYDAADICQALPNAPKRNMRATRNGACASLRILVSLLYFEFASDRSFFFLAAFRQGLTLVLISAQLSRS
jgi:hypothetical protein